MKVLTLSKEQLRRVVSKLADSVKESNFSPNAIVGIRTGGEHIARLLSGKFPESHLIIVKKTRSSTKVKKGLNIGLVLRRLPYAVTDRLRVIEHRMRERNLRNNDEIVPLKPSAIEIIYEMENKDLNVPEKILIADDAVDTGSTMRAVVSYYQEKYPNAEIRTLAIACTMKDSTEGISYYKLGYGTLVRFFWSEDYHA